MGPIDLGGQYPTPVDYYSRPWLEVVRKLMIAILIILLIGPMLLAARRWYNVGGTFRVTTDENGNRRIRMVSPNLEVFVNGVPGTVETNGTKLDRQQVFSLPEIEYTGEGLDEENKGDYDVSMEAEESTDDASVEHENSDDVDRSGSEPLMQTSIPVSPSRDTVTSGRFVSSSTCSICIDEFVPGEMLRVLPRCDHAFHTECILPWLTERQGCCPMCKVPVLPDELQRSRRHRSRRRRGRRRMVGSSGGQRRHQPQSTPIIAQDQQVPTQPSSDTAKGVRLVPEIEGDLDPTPQAVTPEGSPNSALVPLGTDLAGDGQEEDIWSVETSDLILSEQGSIGFVTNDVEVSSLPADNNDGPSSDTFAASRGE
mmetsp:Transcript_7873/g.14281  ORF Transcript_7873/g.14281 Transcript_7873/m.14281 type:complete len:369 (-) Transcript_7873:2628-3734(-)